MSLKYLSIYTFSFTVFALLSCSNAPYWAESIDKATADDSWLTYHDFGYAAKNSVNISRSQFYERIKLATISDLTVKQFLELNIENHRLERCFLAKTAEEAYPVADRPRATKDVDSVNYHLAPSKPVSPITVAIMNDKNGKKRLIKLDGAHRMIAANILNKQLRILWVDLR